MDEFFRAVVPHLAANLITIWFLGALYMIWRDGRIEGEPDHRAVKVTAYLSVALICFMVGVSLILDYGALSR